MKAEDDATHWYLDDGMTLYIQEVPTAPTASALSELWLRNHEGAPEVPQRRTDRRMSIYSVCCQAVSPLNTAAGASRISGSMQQLPRPCS
jgi:hypothetical protein